VTGVPDGARSEDAIGGTARWDAPAEAVPGPATGQPARPTRPGLVELAAAVLIVSGLIRLFVVALAIGAPPEAGVEATPTRVILETAIQVATIATGVLVRMGRAWVVVVNVVVVLAFIQIISIAGVVSLTFALLFAAASAIVYAYRPWFEAMGQWREMRRDEERRGRRA
jgi:hypothetical protein